MFKTEEERLFWEVKYSVSLDKLQVERIGATSPTQLEGVEKKFWNNYIDVLVPVERRLYKGENWFGGIKSTDIYLLLDEMKKTAMQLKWPVKAYQSPQNVADYKLRLRPTIALLHDVYDISKSDVVSPIRFMNPELPKISVDIAAEKLDDVSFPSRESVTVEIPADYVQIILGLEQRPQPNQVMDFKYIMKPGLYIPSVPAPVITSATQIPRLQQ